MLEPTVEFIPPALSERACVFSKEQYRVFAWGTYQYTGVLVNERQYDVLDLDGTDVGKTLQYTNRVRGFDTA